MLGVGKMRGGGSPQTLCRTRWGGDVVGGELVEEGMLVATSQIVSPASR